MKIKRKIFTPKKHKLENKKSDISLMLSRPFVSLAGNTVKELRFDFEKLTPMDYRNIVRLEGRLRGSQIDQEFNLTKTTSSEFRMATAWVAAVNNPDNGVCYDDIEKISLSDLLELEKIALFFILHVE